jgi:hypothetical protein
VKHQRQRLATAASIMAAALMLLGCPEQTQSDPPIDNTRCREVGQRCEFSPGKLGSCVSIDGCRSGDCFVCQSQH